LTGQNEVLKTSIDILWQSKSSIFFTFTLRFWYQLGCPIQSREICNRWQGYRCITHKKQSLSLLRG